MWSVVAMTRLTVLLALVAAAAASEPQLPDPGELVYVLNEEEFEDYHDACPEIKEPKWIDASSAQRQQRSDCTFRVNGDLGQPQPVYLHNNTYIVPTANSGLIHLNAGEQVLIACAGAGNIIKHPNIAASVSTGTATCVKNALVSGAGWLNGNGEFGQITCSAHSAHTAEYTNDKCYNNNLVIRVGFMVNNEFYPLYWSCFDQDRLEVLYVWYEQNSWNAVYQTGINRPNWLAGSFYPGVTVNKVYSPDAQKTNIASYVGQEMADKYVTSTQFLARGHLAAKSDFIFATGQRSTFYFINAAPQWQPFNCGNWNFLEQNLRTRIGQAGYSTTVYSGTFGVTQLRDQNDRLVDIYLYRDVNNNNQLPVPLYYYKVVYDASRRLGTAFVSINNPYYTKEEVQALTFCADQCRGNRDFDWMLWQPDRIDIGYSFCCTVEDFRKTVPHLPPFTTNGLLY